MVHFLRIILLSLPLTLGFRSNVTVMATTDFLQAHGAYLGRGAYVQTMGKSTTGDSGGALYKIESGTANGNDILAISGSSLVAKLQVQKGIVNALAYGFENDVIQVDSISVSTSGVLTVPSPVFSSSDVGKKFYIRDCFDMRAKYEAYTSYQGVIANYTALPGSPGNKDLYQVTNASDDPLRDTLTGTQYYYWYDIQGRWVWLDSHQAALVEITGYTSPTSVNIDYSRPIDNASGLSGYFGTNNRLAWDNLSQFILDNDYQAYFPGIDSLGYLVNTEFGSPYNVLSTTKKRHDFGLIGDGRGITNIYLTHMPDTGLINADILDPVNNPPAHNCFIRFASTDENQIQFKGKDITFIGVDDVGYRRNDSWPDFSFLSGSGAGQFVFESCEWFGGSNLGYYSNSGSERLNVKYSDCYVDGGQNAMEIMLNWYGENEQDLLFLENSIFKNVGQEQEWSFNAKARGISVYGRHWKSHRSKGCTFENILDRWQDYDGGGVDIIHAFETGEQSFEDCNFIANGKKVNYGYWGSRSSPLPSFKNCYFKGINGGLMVNAIAARNTTKITNCYFGPDVQIPIATISNNNVWSEETFIDVDKCIFFSGGIDIYPNSVPVAPVNFSLRNSEFPIDSNRTDGQRIRLLPGGNTASVLIENVIFKDTNTVTAPIVFFEGGASADVTLKDCYFGINNGSNGMEVIKQLRGPSTVTFENCKAPDSLTISIGIDPYTSESGPKLFGTGNNFNYSISNASGNPGQAFECYRFGSHSGTTDLNGEISVTLDKACNFDFADIQIIGDNAFHADVISIDSSALNVRIKDGNGDVPSTAVNFNYTINKAP